MAAVVLNEKTPVSILDMFDVSSDGHTQRPSIESIQSHSGRNRRRCALGTVAVPGIGPVDQFRILPGGGIWVESIDREAVLGGGFYLGESLPHLATADCFTAEQPQFFDRPKGSIHRGATERALSLQARLRWPTFISVAITVGDKK